MGRRACIVTPGTGWNMTRVVIVTQVCIIFMRVKCALTEKCGFIELRKQLS